MKLPKEVEEDLLAEIQRLRAENDYRKTCRAVNLAKVPPHQVELIKIKNTFMVLLKELKRDADSDLEPAKAATKEIVDKMLAELTKGQDAPLTSVTPEQVTSAIVHIVDGTGLDPEKLAEFRGGLTALFENLPRPDDTQEK